MSTIIGNPIMLGGGSGISAPIIGKDFNWTGGDGTYQVLDDGGGNWRIKFLSSGVFTPLKAMTIDVFLVGAGGGKGYRFCGAGGSGYTVTRKSIVLTPNTPYEIVVGAPGTNGVIAGQNGTNGGATSAFGATAAGGYGSIQGATSSKKSGGDGGSGGGGAALSGNLLCVGGGVDGADGETGDSPGGKGQGTTTREFGESSGDLYATGGGNLLEDTVENSGNGGGRLTSDDSTLVNPASGIVIIRKHKEAAA